MKILVQHEYYGCDTGCCGHVFDVELAPGEDQPKRIDGGWDRFDFDHPYGQDHRAWAEKMVSDMYGADHVADLDWDNSLVLED